MNCTTDTLEPEIPSSTSASATVDQMVARAKTLYSLPAVAVEVIRLTSNPQIDAHELKECIELDPALTAKILRVVNSSLFGLRRQVIDLNQALALLGTKPLKLLVLGFSLPDSLFREVAGEQLDWYWKTTLTRAISAREISEQLYHRPGDDGFLAALLQDVGVLVLLGELREPYARILDRVIHEGNDLHRVGIESLGFDHLALSTALLEQWGMPELLVRSLAEPRAIRRLGTKKTECAELAQIVHLAELLAQLVGQNRLGVLPDLLEAGEAYCGLDKQGVSTLVESLQPKVVQLAEVLSVDLSVGHDYDQILIAAHRQMAELAEDVVEPLHKNRPGERQPCDHALADAMHLRRAVDTFLQSGASEGASESESVDAVALAEPTAVIQDSADVSQTGLVDNPTAEDGVLDELGSQLTLAVGQCRSLRQPISVVLFEARCNGQSGAAPNRLLADALEQVCRESPEELVPHQVFAASRGALILPDCDRREAIDRAHEVLKLVDEAQTPASGATESGQWTVNAGVASAAAIAKNFPPLSLMVTADRCLASAHCSGSRIVKSLEIY